MREIAEVKFARMLSQRPGCIPIGRPRGAKAQGCAYESAVANAPGFRDALHGQWIEYSDATGHGFAQPDFVFVGDIAVVAEVKLTWKLGAYAQLRKVYFPLLRAMGHRVAGVVVCRNLTHDTPRESVAGSLAEALWTARRSPQAIPVLHLPLLLPLESSRHGDETPLAKRVPSWWRKGEAAPGTGRERRRANSAPTLA